MFYKTDLKVLLYTDINAFQCDWVAGLSLRVVYNDICSDF